MARYSFNFPQLAGASISQVFDDMGVQSEVKFVNDVFVNNKKVAGILSKGTLQKDFVLELGIGVI